MARTKWILATFSEATLIKAPAPLSGELSKQTGIDGITRETIITAAQRTEKGENVFSGMSVGLTAPEE